MKFLSKVDKINQGTKPVRIGGTLQFFPVLKKNILQSSCVWERQKNNPKEVICVLYPDIAENSNLRIVNQYKRPVLNRTERDKGAYDEIIFQLKKK